MKVAIIFHRLGPYHCARLAAATRVGEVAAIELSGETGEYAWAKVHGANGYQRVTLFPGDSREASSVEIEERVSQALENARADVVAIPGWSDKGALAALKWCCENNTPTILMSESTAHDEQRQWWKEWGKRRLIGLCSTALVGGRLHKQYLQQLGMSAERIFTGYDVVDNAHFKHLNSQPSTLNLPPHFFLASARFVPKKNLELLLRAYAAYRDAAGDAAWKLVLLGDGPLRSALDSQLLTLNLTDSALLPGFKQYDELPCYYGHASAFVHASATEQWGLVVNEAIAAGLPVIVSNRCGCVPELVHEGVNGWTFAPTDQSALTRCLSRMASLPAIERERFSKASRAIAAQYGPENFARGLKQAAELALILPRRNASALQRVLLNQLLHQ